MTAKTEKVYYNTLDFFADVRRLAKRISDESTTIKFKYIHGVPQGGVPLAVALCYELNLSLLSELNGVNPQEVLVVDDLIDSGATRRRYKDYYFACLYDKRKEYTHMATIPPDKLNLLQEAICVHRQNPGWIVFFWEGDETKSIEDSVIRQLQFIGEDLEREGLKETPARVVNSWKEIYAGYRMNVEDYLTSFESEGYDEIILLKDIEFYSTCEHHMQPFTGKAHVAYIPNKKVIGISKLARIVEVFARRLQIQERIGIQVVNALMEHLNPVGAACIIEAKHFCMCSRGVNKQNSIMTTSCLKGVFRDVEGNPARQELLDLIK